MSSKMGPNERILREVYDGYTRGQTDLIYAFLSPDVTWTVAGDPSIQPYTGHFKGDVAVRRFFKLMWEEWAIEKYTVEEFIVQNDERFAVKSTSRGRNLQTGRWTDFWKLDLVTMKDGKCTSYTEYNDTAALAACLPEKLVSQGKTT